MEELREEVLWVAKATGFFLCTIDYNMQILFQKGEELESYKKLWINKLEAAKEDIQSSQTTKRVFEIVNSFDKELLAYTQATKVDTADKAMEIAHSFIKKYSSVALPLKAIKEDNIWTVDIDVGALAVKIAKVKVDARTGDILSYDIPSKENKENK